MLSRNGKANSNGVFDWGDAVCDAGIMAGLTFFTTLGALGATGLFTNPSVGFVASTIAAGAMFFEILAVKRKLTAKSVSKPEG